MIQGQKFVQQHENNTIEEEANSTADRATNGNPSLGSTPSVDGDVKDSKSCNIQ